MNDPAPTTPEKSKPAAGRERALERPQDTAALAAALQRPEAYSRTKDAHGSGVGAEIGYLQTHISLLFFVGDRVYKVKKAVDLGFLDFTTLAKRKHFCEEEVRLNRRLAPHVYLGVVPIVRAANGSVRVGAPGEVIDWAVEMVRLPEARMLAHKLDRGEVDNQLIGALVKRIADFHATCPTGADVDEFGSPAAIASNVDENYAQLADFVGSDDGEAARGLAVMSAAQHAFLAGRRRRFLGQHAQLLEERVRAGRIRDGHGDLHAGNVCYTDEGVVAYDCIEFNRRFRCGDVAADVAFLAMDLDQRGYPAFSKYLVRHYADVADDRDLLRVVDFYKGYRAVVRGKVAALTAVDPLQAERRHDLRREALRYLQLAAAYELPPAMILMCGLPASGKSWLAKRLARPLRAALLTSDVRRKILAGIAPTRRAGADYEAGLYAPELKQRTYQTLCEDALAELRSGHSVVVDATFSRAHWRAPFVDAAARLELPYYVVHVEAPERVIRARLARRAGDKRSASDADIEVYLRERESFERPDEVPAPHRLEVASDDDERAVIPEEQSAVVIDRMIALATTD